MLHLQETSQKALRLKPRGVSDSNSLENMLNVRPPNTSYKWDGGLQMREPRVVVRNPAGVSCVVSASTSQVELCLATIGKVEKYFMREAGTHLVF
jgi:hypothetical protein